MLLSLCHRKITHPRSQSRWAVGLDLSPDYLKCKAMSTTTDCMASNLGRWNVGQARADGATEAPKTRWPTCTPLANCSKCQRDDGETFPILGARGSGSRCSWETWEGQAKQQERKQSWREEANTARKSNCTCSCWQKEENQTEKVETQSPIDRRQDKLSTVPA